MIESKWLAFANYLDSFAYIEFRQQSSHEKMVWTWLKTIVVAG